jgi:hypothetical protein
MVSVRLLLFICVLSSLVHSQTLENSSRRDGQTMKPASVSAPADYRQLSLADCASAPDEYLGKLVAVTAEVVSVDVKYQAIKLFEANTKTLMKVSLARLTKAQRRSLVMDPVHRVSVYGNVTKRGGRWVIEAHKVIPLATDTAAQIPGRQ